MKYGVDLNMDQNAIQNAVIQPLASAPASGVAGQIYFNSTDKKLYQYDGTVWKQVGIASAFSAGEITANSIPLTLAESDGTTSTVTIVGAGGATLSKSGSTITITTSDNDTTYDAGTFQELQDGTVTTVKVWSPSVLAQYVSGLNALAWEHADTALAAAQSAQEDASTASTAAASAVNSANSAISLAQSAQTSAAAASTAANQAVSSAASAVTAAQNAQADATTAANAASSAVTSAERAGDAAASAGESAASASESALTASKHLSDIENVVGTVEWIREHAVYELTTDTEVDQMKWYYSVVASTVSNPTKYDLSHKRYYELDYVYRLTLDEEIDSDKTYYTESEGVYTEVTDPVVEDIETYYEKYTVYINSTDSEPATGKTYYTLTSTVYNVDISDDPYRLVLYEITSYDESVRDYIDNYLSMDEGGLHLKNGTGGRIDITTSNGVQMYNPQGKVIAQYGANAIIGNELSYHIKIDPGETGVSDPRLSFNNGETEIAYMTDDKLWIPNVVVVKSMQAGNWMWDSGTNKYHLTLRWIEGGE